MLTNNHNISLNMAVWLAHDDYDYNSDENYISVTSLIKPIKSIVLSMRAEPSIPDIMDFVASRMGTALHTASENAWLDKNYKKSLHRLGYPQDVINKIHVNPNIVSMDKNDINVFLEKRSIKEINGYQVGGKFDACIEGAIRDIKSVKAFSYTKNDMTDYILQLSMYRWLNDKLITSDIGYIDMIITDWKAYEYEAKPDTYPPHPIVEKKVTLMSIEETEAWVSNKLNQISSLMNVEESNIPQCTTQELWQDPSKYAYYKKPDAKRATKVFTNIAEANQRLIDDGSTGRVETREGKPKRCNYCNARDVCQQAQGYVAQGLL